MWPWRDWVIDAFNPNMPFDQFTVEQTRRRPAARTPPATRSSPPASTATTGSTARAARSPRSAGSRPSIDRVETTGPVWLGLTLGCARCHDHKYDPITQKEFYQLFAFFNNVPESGMVGTEAKNTEPTDHRPHPGDGGRAGPARRGRDRGRPARGGPGEGAAPARRGLGARVPQAGRGTVAAWTTLEPRASSPRAAPPSPGSTTPPGSRAGPTRRTTPTRSPHRSSRGAFSGLLLETFPDPCLPNGSLGRYPNGNYVLTGVEAEVVTPGEETPRKVKFASAEADYSQPNYEAQAPASTTTRPTAGRSAATTRTSASRASSSWPPTPRSPSPKAPRSPSDSSTTRSTATTSAGSGSRPPRGPREMVKLDDAKGGAEHPDDPRRRAGEADRRSRRPSWPPTSARRSTRRSAGPTTALASASEGGEGLPRLVPQLDGHAGAAQTARGLPADPRASTTGGARPSTPACPPRSPPCPPAQPMNRLGLARWIVDPANPLTARVWVNRAWEKFFGTGLVEDDREPRVAGRVPQPPRAARLAGHRVRPPRLGHEGDPEADRDERDLPAVARRPRPP